MNGGVVVDYVGVGCPVLGLARKQVARTVQNHKSHRLVRFRTNLGTIGHGGQSHDAGVQVVQAQVERSASGLGWVGGSVDPKAVFQLVYGPQVSR